ncbi:extracellular solute-binding protein [Olsenella uli]|uniref:extracellular solute-binding protein n=1 Tax=Olsenella uli TaxID=133926 RepID=UPI00336BEA26
MDSVSGAINVVPGMVLGIAFLFAFSGTPIQGTFVILIVCNVVHYFATPYQMMKDSLTKMNASWETTAKLMGDSWWKTIVRVVTPNAWPTILQVFGYYFVSAMVTISAVVFLTGAHTMVITTKISSLQHLAEFDSIFALSLGILVINLAVKGLIALLTRDRSARTARKSIRMRDTGRSDQSLAQGLLGQPEPPNNRGLVVAGVVVVAVLAVTTFAGLTRPGEGEAAAPAEGQVVIASNADEEALAAYRNALDAAGYEGQYVIQSFGTSELGGKLLAEGTNLEADVITMSSCYVDSAEDQNAMFAELTDVEAVPLDEMTPAWRAPAQAQEGAIFYNTEVLASEGLPVPTSLRDLADPVYEGMVSLPDITGSSTAWLLIQALVDAYGEAEAQEILTGIYRNAGPYLSQSGSAPIKNVRAGEVAIGFGLRHQALADKAEGLPIEVVDPAEGTYSLTESVAVVDKGGATNPLAQEMAAAIIDGGRAELMQTYAKTLYEGEVPADNTPADQREFPEPLTVGLLDRHQELSEAAKRAAA